MGFYGNICIYPKNSILFSLESFSKILMIVRPQNSSLYTPIRTIGKSEEWKKVKRYFELEKHFITGTLTNELEHEYEYYSFEEEAVVFSTASSFERALEYYQEGTKLSILISNALLTYLVEESLANSISEEIAGDFRISQISLNIGDHDIYEAMSEETAQLFARTFFSLQIGGQGSPKRWNIMREEISKLSEIEILCKNISQVIGEVKICSYWNG